MLNDFFRATTGAKAIFGTVAVAGGTPSLSKLTGDAVDQAQVSIEDTGAGDYNIVVANFKGPLGFAIGIGCGTTISTMINNTAATYSGDTATFTFKVEDDASSATDNAGFHFILVAC